MHNLHNQLYLLTALIEYLTVLLEYLNICKLGGRAHQAFGRAWVPAKCALGYVTV